MWIQALSHIVQATKSVELQKEHENYLRSQFQAADVTKDGYLLLDEFAGKTLKLHKNPIGPQRAKKIKKVQAKTREIK